MPKNKLSLGRPVPTQWKFRIDADFDRVLTCRERLQILIGYRLKGKLTVVTQHSPGNHQEIVDLRTTKEFTNHEQIQNRVAKS